MWVWLVVRLYVCPEMDWRLVQGEPRLRPMTAGISAMENGMEWNKINPPQSGRDMTSKTGNRPELIDELPFCDRMHYPVDKALAQHKLDNSEATWLLTSAVGCIVGQGVRVRRILVSKYPHQPVKELAFLLLSSGNISAEDQMLWGSK